MQRSLKKQLICIKKQECTEKLLAGGKVLAVHRLFARAGELKDGASELTEFSFAEVETYAK